MATKSAQIYEHQRVGARSIQMEPNTKQQKKKKKTTIIRCMTPLRRE